MNRFGGGTPRCPTCDKLVYAAEQVLGPGRKVYHKPCLKCTSCSRRLDSLSLLEHNQEVRKPYCKPCHVKNFGTRDLRSANLTPSSTPLSPPRTRTLPTTSSADSPTSRPSSIPEAAKSEGDLEDASLDTEDATVQEISDDMPRTTSPTASSPTKSTWTPPTYSARPLSPASTGPPAAGSNKDMSPRPLKQSNTGNVGAGIARKTFGPSPGFEGTPRCPRCGKAVYFAEQVKASGKTWHKPCLRCTECSVLLDSTRLTEKDGIVMCRSCYSKLHGPQGSGYALLGRAG